MSARLRPPSWRTPVVTLVTVAAVLAGGASGALAEQTPAPSTAGAPTAGSTTTPATGSTTPPAPTSAPAATAPTTTTAPPTTAPATTEPAPAPEPPQPTPAPPAEEPATDPGDVVVGTLVQAVAEPLPARPGEPVEAHAEHADEPLSWIETADGDAVRVPTDDVEDIEVGAEVAVTVGAEVPDVAAAEGLEAAVDVLAAEVLSAAPVDRQTTAQALADVNHPVTVVMLVPAGGTRDSTTLAQVRAAVDGPVADFWARQTNGRVRLGVSAGFDWTTTAATCSNPNALWNAAAARSGWVDAPGRHLLVYVPYATPGCSYGLAEMRSNTSSGGRLYVEAAATSVIAHELGHNFGLDHSSQLQCSGALETGTCQVSSYRDYYDVMGVSWSEVGSLSALQQAALGVLPAGQRFEVVPSAPASTVTLAPISATTGTRAVRLVAADGRTYWVEYRPARGQDAWLGGVGNWIGLQPGVLVRRESVGGNESSLLLDGTPSPSSSWTSDVAMVLPAGRSVQVAGGDFHLLVQATGDSATLSVSTRASGPTTPITLAWQASGGATGTLGAPTMTEWCGLKDGGCFRSFQRGSLYWSAATGVRTVLNGALRDRWGTLGWEAGLLGYPTSDTYCGLTGGGCFQHFQNGSLYGLGTAVYFVRGAVRSLWGATGWETGVLGYPTSDEFGGLVRGGAFQRFQKGAVYWSPTTGAHLVTGAVRERWAALGYETGSLGYPTTDTTCAPAPGTCTQEFQGGTLVGGTGTPVVAVRGAVRTVWLASGGATGRLGLPLRDERGGLPAGGTYQTFQKGAVYWTAATGARYVTGALRTRFASLGYERGVLGYPTGNPVCGLPKGGCTQTFQRGSLVVSSVSPAALLRGGVRQVWDAWGREAGRLGYPLIDERTGLVRGGSYQRFQGGSVYSSPATGAHAVLTVVRGKWATRGYERGLGYPTMSTWCGLVGGGCFQTFETASIYRSPTTPAAVVGGAIREAWRGTGWETGRLGYPTADERCASGRCTQTFQGGTVTWTAATGARVTFR